MLLLMVCLCTPICGQEQPQQLLMGAAQCLVAKKFLLPSKAKTLTFGYVIDQKSYPGEKVLYLVGYAAPTRSNGFVFTIFLRKHDEQQSFSITNNASFVLSRKDPEGVTFIGQPLGGIWTQEHLVSAIKQIEKLPRFTVSTQSLIIASPIKGCEAYTDPFHRQ
jgi:hypothetical protein